MAMGTVPCLLWKWWTWWVVLREEETLAATAGHGNTSSARESTSLKRKAGLAHTAGDTAAGLGACSDPWSASNLASTCCPAGAGPGTNKRPLPLIRHKQEESISKESRAHRPLHSSQGRVKKKNAFKKRQQKFVRLILVWNWPQPTRTHKIGKIPFQKTSRNSFLEDPKIPLTV